MLEFILILLLVYFGLKIIFRFFGPAIMRWMMKKVGKKMERKFQQQYGFSEEKREEGETFIHKKPRRRKKPEPSKAKQEEYVDYEEID
jgi:hypothetical protein